MAPVLVEINVADRAQLEVERLELELQGESFRFALAERVGEGPARLPEYIRLVLGVPQLPLRLAESHGQVLEGLPSFIFPVVVLLPFLLHFSSMIVHVLIQISATSPVRFLFSVLFSAHHRPLAQPLGRGRSL